MAKELDPLKLSSPRIFLFRMLVFVVLGGLVAFVLHKQIEVAFMANPGLNALIIGVLVIGIVLSLPPGAAALSGNRLGQQFPPRRSRPRGRPRRRCCWRRWRRSSAAASAAWRCRRN